MEELQVDKFQKTIFEVQDILFKKGTKEEAMTYLIQTVYILNVIYYY